MQISLIRHGPAQIPMERISVLQLPDWVQRYEESGTASGQPVPERTKRMAEAAKLVVSSNQKRAVQSAVQLQDSLSFWQSPLFREAAFFTGIPAPAWLRLRPEVWLKIGRTLWLAGFGKEIEPYEQACLRAKQAADVLIGYALHYERIALVGHGFFNTMIAKELKQRGWIGPLLPESGYWSCSTYKYNKALAGRELKQSVPLPFA